MGTSQYGKLVINLSLRMILRRQVGPLNNEEDLWKVLKGAKIHEEENSQVGSKTRTRKSINTRKVTHPYAHSHLWSLSLYSI
jgi:hypothetical protein